MVKTDRRKLVSFRRPDTDGNAHAVSVQSRADASRTDKVMNGVAAVARQPIFGADFEVIGYELLYRAVGAEFAVIENPVTATADVIVAAVLDVGLNKLVGSAPAFINFPQELITEDLLAPIESSRIVVEVLEDIAPNDVLIGTLGALRRRGYRVALDDFELSEEKQPLLDHADFVKVDVMACDPNGLSSLLAYLKRWKITVIAEKVETEEQLRLCRELGFDAFQGYFLRRPETFYAKRVPGSRLATIRMLLRLQDPDVSLEELESTIACDVGLCYKLLRCVNSSYFGFRNSVDSIGRAIALIGLDELRAICVAILLSGIEDRPKYLAKQAMVRARMCERLCIAAELGDQQSFFMAGLLSGADVLLGVRLEEAIEALPLTSRVRDAILHGAGEIGEALLCVSHYEDASWSQVRFRELPMSVIVDAYAEGVQWAESLWRLLVAPS